MEDGRIISGSNDGTLRIWDLENPGGNMILSDHTKAVTCLGLLPSGKVVGGDDGSMKIFA